MIARNRRLLVCGALGALVGGLPLACVRPRGGVLANPTPEEARAALFREAPSIPSPARALVGTASGGWRVVSYDVDRICLEGPHVSTESLDEARVDSGTVALWHDPAAPPLTSCRVEVVARTPLPPVLGECVRAEVRVEGGRSTERTEAVGCVLHPTTLRVCGGPLSLAGAGGKTLTVSVGSAAAAWRIE